MPSLISTWYDVGIGIVFENKLCSFLFPLALTPANQLNLTYVRSNMLVVDVNTNRFISPI